MDFETLCETAARNQPPNEMTPIEWTIWFHMRDLYAAYRAKKITPDDAKKKKADYLDWFDEMNRKQKTRDDLLDFYIGLWSRTEYAAREYCAAETHTPEADRMYAALYGLPRGVGVSGKITE